MGQEGGNTIAEDTMGCAGYALPFLFSTTDDRTPYCISRDGKETLFVPVSSTTPERSSLVNTVHHHYK